MVTLPQNVRGWLPLTRPGHTYPFTCPPFSVTYLPTYLPISLPKYLLVPPYLHILLVTYPPKSTYQSDWLCIYLPDPCYYLRALRCG